MKKRIMIFDDDNDILEVCSIVLKTSGFEVVTQNSCEDILKKVAAAAPDVILMDNKIPPAGGIQVSKELKGEAAFRHIPIVFFSANQEVARLAAEAGADYFIEKPFDLDELIMLLEKACSNGAAAVV